MRLAVLLCGVLSGVIALGFGWWGQADALLHVAALPDAVKLAVILAIQPIALASIAGGAAILLFPAISRAALLASAVGWLGLVAILGGGISLPVAILILLSASGGLLGFLPGLREPMFRLQRADAVDDEETGPLQPRGRAALRYDLREAISERAPDPRQWPQPQPTPVHQASPPVPVQQAPQGMPPQPPQPLPVQQQAPQQAVELPPQTPPGPARGLTFSSFETMEGSGAALPQQPPPAPEPPPHPDALPTLGNVMPSTGGDGSWQAYFPPPELATPVPTKPPEIRPAVFVPRFGLDEDHSKPFVPSPDDLRDGPVQPIPPPPPAPQDVRRRSERSSYDFRRDEVPARYRPPPKKRSKAARRRAAIGIGALAIVIIGAPALLVLDAQMRGGDAQVLPAAIEASSSSAASPSSAPSADASQDVADARLPKGGPLAPVDFASEQAAIASSSSNEFAALPPIGALPSGAALTISSGASSEAPVATVAALPMGPKGPPYASPFDYCTALNNSDNPDATKITGGMPAAITTAARSAARLDDGDFHWRCMDRAVWVCVTAKGSPACKPVPNAVDRVLFCASHPDVQVTNSPAGDWSCDGFTPVVSKEQLNAVDRRGFDRNVWDQLPPPAPAPSAG